MTHETGEKGSDLIKALWLQSKDEEDYRYKRQENTTLNTNLNDDAEKRIKRQDNATLSSNQDEVKISR
jgi:hypothetical protein